MAMPEEEGPPGVPEWVVTYGDMMSLLLTFFIMLVSMSEIRNDQGSVRAMLDSLRERFGSHQGMAAVPGKSLDPSSNLSKPTSKGSSSDGGTKTGKEKSAGGGGPYKTVERINSGNRSDSGWSCPFWSVFCGVDSGHEEKTGCHCGSAAAHSQSADRTGTCLA